MKTIRLSTAWLLCACCSTAMGADQTVCHESPAYLVAEGATGEVGTHFLVKYKTGDGPAPVCEYVVKPGDFELRNQDAEYFLALQDDLLILDSGTGPEPRGLIIWDLKKRSKVFSGSYSDATVGKGFIEFWQESAAANEANCPQAGEWREAGLGAAIETRVRLSLADFSLSKGTETRCQARQ